LSFVAYGNEEVNARNIVPTSVKQLRACKKCHLVKTYEQFMQVGCENCDDTYDQSALELDEKENNVTNSTSANFSGMIAYMFDDDSASWVARCHALRMDQSDSRRKPGIYAMQLNVDEVEEAFDYEY
jgi:transcription elongation factor SPT4